MPPPNVRGIYLLESADGNVGTILDLIEGHIGQAGVAVCIERPRAESAIKVFDCENSFVDGGAVWWGHRQRRRHLRLP